MKTFSREVSRCLRIVLQLKAIFNFTNFSESLWFASEKGIATYVVFATKISPHGPKPILYEKYEI